MNSKYQQILIENGLIYIPNNNLQLTPTKAQLATILGNITYYGFSLSESVYTKLTKMGSTLLNEWWTSLEAALKAITGDDKKMGDFVVYKNFPAEVLDKSEGEYWLAQILMYWGFPNELFTEDAKDRETVIEQLPTKVLHLADDNSFSNIANSLLHSSVRWTDRQWKTIVDVLARLERVDVSAIPFKENMVQLTAFLMKNNYNVTINTATDVLRLAIGLSDGDISLRTNSKFRKFSRPERRFLLGLLNNCKNLEEDVARKRGQFKRLFFQLHPGDYKNAFGNVIVAYDKIYRGTKIKTFNSEIERLLHIGSPEGLALLKTRPGEFLRRLRVALEKYGAQAVVAFCEIMPRLSIHQLLKIERYLLTVNDREYRTFAPNGNWTKLQIVESSHRLNDGLVISLSSAIAREVGNRVSASVPSVNLSIDTSKIKLQGNDSELTPYGRGTVFDIPENINFMRSASYWKTGGGVNNIWYDNGWNFFNDEWKPMGVLCWTDVKYANGAAVFSGDPTSSKDIEGNACQMIDLYLNKLAKANVRYAVWNILAYSRIPFDGVDEVYAALQWGEESQKNKLFEPSRNVFAFPLNGSNLTKYVAFIDVLERKLVYIDANLYGHVSSAASNQEILSEKMPAFVEYLSSLPSVYDLFKRVPRSRDGMPVLYDDSEISIDGGKAFVFKPQNEENTFEQFDVNALLVK